MDDNKKVEDIRNEDKVVLFIEKWINPRTGEIDIEYEETNPKTGDLNYF